MSNSKNLNEGYEDGFNDVKAQNPNNEDYRSGYKIGVADREERLHHLSMKDWLNDKSDERNKSGNY